MIGKLLVASPSILNDHVFSRSVILMIENSGTGSMGFIVNKQTNYCLDDLIKGSKSNDIETILGYRGKDEVVHRDDLVLEKK